MDFECPACNKDSHIEGEHLPECACDTIEWECPKCGAVMQIGWYATIEARSDYKINED